MNDLKAWFKKADLDFFGPFSSIFFTFNGWYKLHYKSKFNPDSTHDSVYVNHIKTDFSPGGLFEIFSDNFYHISNNIPLLFSALKNFPIYHRGVNINLNSIVLYERSLDNIIPLEDQTPENVICYLLELDSLPQQYKDPVIPDSMKLGNIYISDNKENLFNEIITIIYKIRCALVHGDLIPNTETNDIVKYSYFILYDLLKPILS